MSKLEEFLLNKKKQNWVLNIYDLDDPINSKIKNIELFYLINKLKNYEYELLNIIIKFIDFEIDKIYNVNIFNNNFIIRNMNTNLISLSLLTQLHIHKSKICIIENTFCCCYHLNYIELYGNIVNISKKCFSNCINLTTIKIIAKNEVYLGDYNFFNCYKLRTLTIKSLNCLISSKSFRNCLNIKYINLPFKTILCPYSLPNNSTITINSHPVAELIKLYFHIKINDKRCQKIYDLNLEKYRYNSLELKAKREEYI